MGTVIPVRPTSFIQLNHPAEITVLGVSGTKRVGNAVELKIKVRCRCNRVFEAGKSALEQGLVKCCDACLFDLSDAYAKVLGPRPRGCRGGRRR